MRLGGWPTPESKIEVVSARLPVIGKQPPMPVVACAAQPSALPFSKDSEDSLE